MPNEPALTPIQTPTVTPSVEPEWQADPERLCPNQKETLTRTIAPFLP